MAEDTRIADISRKSIDLFPRSEEGVSLGELLMKVDTSTSPTMIPGKDVPSGQKSYLGRKQRPFDFQAVTKFQTANVHHSTCIHTKVASAVGLGFETAAEKQQRLAQQSQPAGSPEVLTKENLFTTQSKPDELLDPLCNHSFQDVLNDVAEDFFQVGNGYMEIVRETEDINAPIVGIHHIPAAEVWIFLEDLLFNKHYEIAAFEGGLVRHFAEFGDLGDFIKRAQAGSYALSIEGGPSGDIRSEVIHFREPTSMSRWYGFPKWLSATQSIELVQCLLQQKYDFFLNRGVPEFMLFLLGKKLSDKDWEKVLSAMRAHIGIGNSHKSLALNLDDPEMKVQLEKLAMDSKGDGEFGSTKENLALDIVSAHRVPPLLAGIQIPGKLGANNELPNALMAFHLLVAGPAQRIFKQKLSTTLGNKDLNGGLALGPDDFTFRTVIDHIGLQSQGLQQMDTLSRMRTPAAGSGRDLTAGVKD